MKSFTKLVLVGLTLSVIAPSSGAQLNRPQAGQRQAQQRRPAKKNFAAEFAAIAVDLGKTLNARVVVDPLIFVINKPSAPKDETIEAALNTLTTGMKNVAWRRAYLNQAGGGGVSNPAKLAAAVRAMEMVEQSGLVTENVATRRASTLIKSYEVTDTFKEDLAASKFGPEPIYVIYSTASDSFAGMTAEEKFQDLQRQQMEMMLQMNPDEMAQAMTGSMNMMMNMDPAARSQMMGSMMKAGMQMFQNMPADQRNALMQDMAGMMQGAFGGGGPPRRP